MDAGGPASGEALRIRVAARTTTLTQVAKTGAEGLERILRHAAEWVGADPEEVEVEPFTEFADIAFGGQELLYLVQAKKLGAPLSTETIHAIMASHDMTTKTYEEEQDAIKEEGDGLGDPGLRSPGAVALPGQPPGQLLPGQQAVPGQQAPGQKAKPEDKQQGKPEDKQQGKSQDKPVEA
jgi:hypothetical protein